MNTPFRLDDHKRRPAPVLAPPPADYFERLPRQIMARVQPQAAPQESVLLGWLAALSRPARTALASVVVLGSFATSFFLSQPSAPAPSAPVVALEAVPHTEMVQYLLATDSRVTLSDLAELPAADHTLTDSFLRASPDELQDALDAQPTDDTYL